MTLPEVLLWRALRKRRLGKTRFRRQHPVGPFILDFFARPRSWRWRWTAGATKTPTRCAMTPSAPDG
nr:endonuclease domain-containing protein [Brevundimonas denitrificans]